MNLLHKTINVINSCETLEQLETACKFTELTLYRITTSKKFSKVLEVCEISQEFKSYIHNKRKKILEEKENT